MKKAGEPTNLLTLKPKRNLEWERSENDLITLVIPKFRNRFIVKWLVPMLAKPNIRVKLDERGTYVWDRCDGNTTVAEIGESMSGKFGEPTEVSYDRIEKFIQRLARDEFLVLGAN